MDAIKLTVRCIAWPEGEVWVAACIDLTLAAQESAAASSCHSSYERASSN